MTEESSFESFTLLSLRPQITRCKCQVVNVGAGFDTLYWNLKNEGLAPASFIEVDFPDVTMKKCHVIKSKQPLLEVVHSEGKFLDFDDFSCFSSVDGC